MRCLFDELRTFDVVLFREEDDEDEDADGVEEVEVGMFTEAVSATVGRDSVDGTAEAMGEMIVF